MWIIKFKLTSVLCIKTLARSSNLNYFQTFFHYKRNLYSKSYKNNIHEFLHRQTFSLSLFFETRIILKKLLFVHEIGIDHLLRGKTFWHESLLEEPRIEREEFNSRNVPRTIKVETRFKVFANISGIFPRGRNLGKQIARVEFVPIDRRRCLFLLPPTSRNTEGRRGILLW